VPNLAVPEGLSIEECDALEDWRDTPFFGERDRAVLAYTDAMTRDIAVPDEVFTGVKAHFSQRQIVELTLLIGAYNMQSRVFQALEIDAEPVPGR
jgi:alkylhydroperoxidase family enzyme